MKKSMISFAVCFFILTFNGMAQEKHPSAIHDKTATRNVINLKSGLVGSYPQHIVEYQWVTDWVLSKTTEISYTGIGEPSTIEVEQADGTKIRDRYTYDSQNRQTENLTQSWIEGNWVNQSRMVLIYNDQGYEAENRVEYWQNDAWIMLGGSQITYEWDGNRVTRMTIKNWNPALSAWENYYRETISYPGTGSQYQTTVNEYWENDWVKTGKHEYTWNNDRISEDLAYIYQEDQWVLSGKTFYEYPDLKYIVTSFTYLGSDNWMPTKRYTIEFDTHGNTILNQTEMYAVNWMITTAARFQLTYSGNDVTERITQTYSIYPPGGQQGTMTGTWKNLIKEVFSNFASLSVNTLHLPEAGISVFPNPSGDQVVIRLSLPETGRITLSVLSINGQKMLEENFISNGLEINHSLNLSKISQGSYILKAVDKNGMEIGKTLLIKQ